MIASRRRGKAAGPGRLRTTAMRSANTRTSASPASISSMLMMNPSQTGPALSAKSSVEKKASWTRPAPGAVRNVTTTIARKTIVLTDAIRTEWRPAAARSRPSAAVPLTRSALLDDWDVSRPGEPLVLELRQRPVVDHLLEHPVDVLAKLAALLEHDAPVLVGDELPDDDEVVRILGDEPGGDRQVDDEGVDRLVQERLVGGRRRGEDTLLLGRLDRATDIREPRRGLLCAEEHTLDVLEGRRVLGVRSLVHEDGLVRLEVRDAEVDHLVALVGDGRLVDVEVERLGCGREEVRPDELDPLRLQTQPSADLLGDVDLEAGWVVGEGRDDERRRGRLGADGEHSVLLEDAGEIHLHFRPGARGLGRLGFLVVTPTAGAQRQDREDEKQQNLPHREASL